MHIRLPNLIIAFITQFIFYYFTFYNNVAKQDLLLGSKPLILVSFIIVTLIITICGYLINDYYDYELDNHNKNTENRLSKGSIILSYTIFNIIGFGLSVVIVSVLDVFPYLGIYIIANLLLWMYSAFLKANGFIGNIIVSLFSAGVILILLLAEFANLALISSTDASILFSPFNALIFFSIFIFLISLVREIIKDCEDLSGDSIAGMHTLPIRYGLGRTKYIVFAFLILLMIASLAWTYIIWKVQSNIFVIQFITTIIFPQLYLGRLILKSKEKKHFSKISLLSKVIMVFGIAYYISYNLWN